MLMVIATVLKSRRKLRSHYPLQKVEPKNPLQKVEPKSLPHRFFWRVSSKRVVLRPFGRTTESSPFQLTTRAD